MKNLSMKSSTIFNINGIQIVIQQSQVNQVKITLINYQNLFKIEFIFNFYIINS